MTRTNCNNSKNNNSDISNHHHHRKKHIRTTSTITTTTLLSSSSIIIHYCFTCFKCIMATFGFNMILICTLTFIVVFQTFTSYPFHILIKSIDHTTTSSSNNNALSSTSISSLSEMTMNDYHHYNPYESHPRHQQYIDGQTVVEQRPCLQQMNTNNNNNMNKQYIRYNNDKTNQGFVDGGDNNYTTSYARIDHRNAGVAINKNSNNMDNNNNNNNVLATTTTTGNSISNTVITTSNRRLRVLMGILSTDSIRDQILRRRHRTFHLLWKDDKRFCSLSSFIHKPIYKRYECEVIYTFVIAAAHTNSTTVPPVLLDNSRPIVVSYPYNTSTIISNDLNKSDITFLNIRENMNEGKSQTWLYYGTQIAEEYDLDYIIKCDTDTIFKLHEFVSFAYHNMPPAPYNTMMYIGALRDKAYWPRKANFDETFRYEQFFQKEYEGIHLYVAGQIYIVSTDLAKYISQEAATVQYGNCSYCEGHEDHDITSIAFHSPQPIKLVVIGHPHRFWIHPAKLKKDG